MVLRQRTHMGHERVHAMRIQVHTVSPEVVAEDFRTDQMVANYRCSRSRVGGRDAHKCTVSGTQFGAELRCRRLFRPHAVSSIVKKSVVLSGRHGHRSGGSHRAASSLEA